MSNDCIGSFDSLTEFVQAAQNPALPCADNRSKWQYWRDSTHDDWYGLDKGYKLDGVAQLVRDGWQHGADRISDVIERSDVPRLPSIRRRRVWTDNGDEVNMDKVYGGRLDTAWSKVRKPQCRGVPRVRIVVDALAYGSEDAEALFWKGAAAVVLGEALISAGYTVEVLSSFKGSHGSSTVRLDVTVKPYNAPWNLSDAAATMALPAFFRCIGHAWYCGHMPVECSTGMSVHNLELKDVTSSEALHTFLAPQSITNKDKAEKWVAKCIAKLTSDGTEEEA